MIYGIRMVVTNREEAKEFCFILMERWGVDLRRELPGGFCSFVMTDGVKVLKVPFQGEEQTTGRLAAERLAGSAGPKIHRADEESGSLLMDYVPGEQLAAFGTSDADSMPVFLELALRIRTIDPSGLPDLSTYYQDTTDLIEKLVATTSEKVFLHADLHHLNILGAGEHWTAIDPLGFCGDPAFEAVAYLRNPIEALGEVRHLEPFLERRIHLLALGLGVDPARVFAWSLADRRAGTEDQDHPWGRMRDALENLAGRFIL